MADQAEIERLNKIAQRIRCDIIWALVHAGSGHPGGSLSATDFSVALYFHTLKHDPGTCTWEGRDRVIFSKGHVSPLIFSLLAEAGSISVGLALGLRLDHKPNRVYCIMGDGENQEGSTWEAIMSAGHFKLDNVCAILDNNGLQIDGWVEDVMGIQPIADKWRSFRWHVIEIDGHDMAQCVAAFDEAQEVKGQPTVIIAKTVKGKGVSFMENRAEWHGKAPKPDEARQALQELSCPTEYFYF
jgi:transketolase